MRLNYCVKHAVPIDFCVHSLRQSGNMIALNWKQEEGENNNKRSRGEETEREGAQIEKEKGKEKARERKGSNLRKRPLSASSHKANIMAL